ncbi:MAG TPA: tetratricopeptide repeat protein [Burkholderiales bacterium]|nr:tetratricopeptide repeat protein [Burkholderiales bacterium]
MSLLLEALKKAEKAKEEAQKRTQEGGDAGGGELRLADESAAAPADEKRVVTRDELPPITAPLEIQSEDLPSGAAAGGGSDLSLQPPARPASEAPPRPAPEPQAAQRAAARKPFEAKVREPNPRMPFYITMGLLGSVCIGTVIYFYIQLSSPPSIYVKNPKPPSGEQPVAVAPPQPAPGAGVQPGGPGNAIPGLPSVAPAPAQPLIAQGPAPTPPSAKPAPAPTPPVQAAPRASAPRAAPKPRVRAPAVARAPEASEPLRTTVARSRPAPMVDPAVSAGYSAYQAGDLDRARRDYETALRDDPSNRDALLGLAAVETQSRRFPEAELLYRRVLEMDPRDAHAQAGLLGLRAGRLDPVSAESRLKGLIAAESEESVLYFSLGNQYAQQNRWAEARQAYAKAVAFEPENPDYAYNYAISLEHARQAQAALEQYRRALTLGLKRTPSFDPRAAEERVQALSR